MTITSAKTARNQLPRIHRILKGLKKGTEIFDIGCGKSEKFQDWCDEHGFKYVGYDPYHQSKMLQDVTLGLMAMYPPQVVTISNVLNVIKERDERIKVLKQAKGSLRNGGLCFITVYDGGDKRNMEAGKTRDGWQNRKPIDWYYPECEEVFGGDLTNVFTTSGVKYILAVVAQ